MIGEKQPIVAELWVVYEYYFFFQPIEDSCILHILLATHIYVQPESRLQLL